MLLSILLQSPPNSSPYFFRALREWPENWCCAEIVKYYCDTSSRFLTCFARSKKCRIMSKFVLTLCDFFFHVAPLRCPFCGPLTWVFWPSWAFCPTNGFSKQPGCAEGDFLLQGQGFLHDFWRKIPPKYSLQATLRGNSQLGHWFTSKPSHLETGRTLF